MAKYIVNKNCLSSDIDIKLWKTEFTFSIFLCIIAIYLLYSSKIITKIPCDNSFISILIRNFIHTNMLHIISNIAGLVILYKIESTSGFHQFAMIFLSILLLNTIIEYILYSYADINCSIGLSGIIFGFAIFELINHTECTLAALTALLAMIVIPSIKNTNISIIGHLTGVLAGFIVAIVYKIIYQKK